MTPSNRVRWDAQSSEATPSDWLGLIGLVLMVALFIYILIGIFGPSILNYIADRKRSKK